MLLQSPARDLTGIRESVGRYASKVLDHARDAHVSRRYSMLFSSDLICLKFVPQQVRVHCFEVSFNIVHT